MKTTKLSKGNTIRINRLKEGILRNFALTLLNAGFRILVYIPSDKRPVKWVIFEKDGKLGNCSLDEFGDRLRFSTIHKPAQKIGTGYGLQMPYEGLTEPTIQDAEQAFIMRPRWACDGRRRDPMPVKYKDLEEYMSRENVLKYDLINGIEQIPTVTLNRTPAAVKALKRIKKFGY